jgi:hypothetical protein
MRKAGPAVPLPACAAGPQHTRRVNDIVVKVVAFFLVCRSLHVGAAPRLRRPVHLAVLQGGGGGGGRRPTGPVACPQRRERAGGGAQARPAQNRQSGAP